MVDTHGDIDYKLMFESFDGGYPNPAVSDFFEDYSIPTEFAVLLEGSPRTYIEKIGAPLLAIQGKNGSRVVEKYPVTLSIN